MPRSKLMRDIDLFIREHNGDLSKSESKVISLKRDVNDGKECIVSIGVLWGMITLLCWQCGISIYPIMIILGFVEFSVCYTVWSLSAEIKTAIAYLEVGLELDR